MVLSSHAYCFVSQVDYCQYFLFLGDFIISVFSVTFIDYKQCGVDVVGRDVARTHSSLPFLGWDTHSV